MIKIIDWIKKTFCAISDILDPYYDDFSVSFSCLDAEPKQEKYSWPDNWYEDPELVDFNAQ